jgi:hypothetical protein
MQLPADGLIAAAASHCGQWTHTVFLVEARNSKTLLTPNAHARHTSVMHMPPVVLGPCSCSVTPWAVDTRREAQPARRLIIHMLMPDTHASCICHHLYWIHAAAASTVGSGHTLKIIYSQSLDTVYAHARHTRVMHMPPFVLNSCSSRVHSRWWTHTCSILLCRGQSHHSGHFF